MGDGGKYVHISIHVLRVEDDLAPWPPFTGADISIHVLRAEDDKNKP